MAEQLNIELNRCVVRGWAGYFILSRYYFGLQHKASKVKRERPVEFELYITSMLFLNLLTINALLAIYSVLTILKYWPIGLTMYMTGVPPYFFLQAFFAYILADRSESVKKNLA